MRFLIFTSQITENKQLVEELSGSRQDVVYIRSTNMLQIKFTSDYSVTGSGFQVLYAAGEQTRSLTVYTEKWKVMTSLFKLKPFLNKQCFSPLYSISPDLIPVSKTD